MLQITRPLVSPPSPTSPNMTSGSPDTKPGKEAATRIPVLLLKTKSTPNDAYEDIFSTSSFADGAYTRNFDPSFVPVLLHQFDDGGIRTMSSLLQAKEITSMPGCRYGGMIFTSQRAVEAFAQVVHTGKGMIVTTPSPCCVSLP